MKFRKILKSIIVISVIIEIISCKGKNENKKVRVFNFDNKIELYEYNKLKLNETHPNLLNPEISKSEYSTIAQSWINLNQNIGKYLSNKKFTWGVKDSTITVIQKFYFNKEGEITNYFFRLKNKNISKEKKEQFANLISDFAKDNKINLKKDKSFAQCGNAKYINQ